MKHRGIGLARLAAPLVLLGGIALGAAAAPAEGDAGALVARAQGDAPLRQALVAEGPRASTFCANCHGANGVSRYGEVPNLAGQHPAYLLRQIEAFRTGRRKNEFMEGLTRVLGERDKAAIVLHYAAAPVTPAAPAPGPRAAAGAALYAQHCARCHQADARGAETYPRLAGQQPEYLRINLQRYLTQSGERIYAPMTAAVAQLGRDNVDAVVQYLSSLR